MLPRSIHTNIPIWVQGVLDLNLTIQPVVADIWVNPLKTDAFSLQLGPTPTSYFQPYGNMVTFLKNFGMTPPWFPHLYIKCDWSLGNRIQNCSVGHGFMWYSKDLFKITSKVRVGTPVFKDEHFMQKDKTSCEKRKRCQARLQVSWKQNCNCQAVVTGTDQCCFP